MRESNIPIEDRERGPPVAAERAEIGCFTRLAVELAATPAPRFGPLSLDDRASRGLSRLLPSLVCGEESAAIVFGVESRRLEAEGGRKMRAALLQIASEESQHEQMLRELGAMLDAPPDLQEIRGRARRFFVRMSAQGESVDHFARIAELDSSVCVVLAAVLRSPAARCPALYGPISRIRRDEARHVVVSRRYVASLGGGTHAASRAADWVRPELVRMLEPASSAFDDLSIDPDELLGRIRRGALP